MAFAKGTGHSLRYAVEKDFGIAPPDGVMREFRMTSCSIVLNKNSFQSNEIRRDAQIADLRHGVKQASGDLGFELSFGAFDDFLAAAIRGEWENNVLVAGIHTPTFTFERAFEDIDQHQVFTGCAVNTLSLDMQSDAMITGTIGIIGKGSEFVNEPAAKVIEPAPMHSPLDCFHGALSVDGVDMAVVTGISLSIDNGIQPANVLARDEAVELIPGQINASGTLTAYFENLDLIDRFVNETETAIEITLGSGGPGTYILKLPRVKFSTGSNPTDGAGPIMLSMSYQALLDTCTGTNVLIERIPLEEKAAKPCKVIWAAKSISEGVRNDGGFDAALLVNLENKEFSGRNDLPLPGVAFENLPEGIDGKATRISDTSARIEFAGKAIANDAKDTCVVNVRFAAAAFKKGFCECQGDTVEGSEQSITLDFRDGEALPESTLLTSMETVASVSDLAGKPDGHYIVR